MKENILFYSIESKELSSKLMGEAYATVKYNLKNILHSVHYCAVCFNNQRESFYQLNFADFNQEYDCSVEGMMVHLFNEEVIQQLSTEYICNICQNNLREAYSFIRQVKNCSHILNNYVEQINNHIDEVHILMKTSNGSDFANTVVLLKNEIKEVNPKQVMPEIDKNPLSTSTNVFKCDFCSQAFRTKSAIAYHINKMHTKRSKNIPIQNCPDCPVYPCIHEKYLIYMKRQKRGAQQLYRCLDCDYATSVKIYLIGHINKDHLDILPHLCEMCGKSFPNKVAHKGHFKRIHQEQLRCSYCNIRVFKEKSYLLAHEANCKVIPKLHRCNACNASFPNIKLLKDHERFHTLNFKCDQCPKAFMYEVTLKKHRFIAHEGGRYKSTFKSVRRDTDCSICPAKFKTLVQLNHHLNTHSADEKHRCNVCEKTYNSRKSYRAHCLAWPHLRRVNPKITFTFKCDDCEFSCTTARSLENHKNVYHLKIKPYECPQCSKAFTTSTHLKHHMERHEGIKKYQCSECSLCVTTLSSLKKHVLRHHAAVKPYPCDACDRSFVNLSERALHKIRVHSEKTSSCPICDVKFCSRVTVRAHIRKVHAKNMKIVEFLKAHEHDPKLMEIFRDHRKPFVES